MILTIIEFLIPVAIKLLGMFLDKKQADKEMMQRFYEFVEKFDKEYFNSVKLKRSYEAQLERLRNGETQ